MRMPLVGLALAACWSAALHSPADGAERISFNREIRPLLADRCFHCHGPSEAAREADLRLDRSDGRHGPFADRSDGPVIQPGKPESSLLWQRLTTDDSALRMPPAESGKQRLSDSELALIQRWIRTGAEYDDFWAFVPPQPQSLPALRNQAWAAPHVDSFVRARLEAAQLPPQPPADRRSLIRRVTLDLTGLPPSLQEIDDFLHDTTPNAYGRLVDRLLATPRYGEHMAKYWLDLVRFADTNGIHHDHYREMTPYRDWVIRAFNDNLAFDDFIAYQIAGDLYPQPSLDQQIASGFNRLHLVIDRGTALPEESYTRNVVDRVSAIGTAFLGLTLGCAVCHDHKYDPVTQQDFYQLFAFFNNLDTPPETPGRNPHPPWIRIPDEAQAARLAAFDAQLAALAAEIEKLKAGPPAPADRPGVDPEAEPPVPRLRELESQFQAVTKARGEFEQQLPLTLVSKERADVRPAFILTRGAYDRPGREVTRNTPAFLPPLVAAGPVKSRLDLAHWLTDENHPLTARVTVNRIWQQFFGVGLVKTSEDFGAQGEYPSHPRLLDHLAHQFVQSGWDVKRLVRLIVMSTTYRQSSRASVDAFRRDPENRLLARGSRFRMDSEMIRDQILFVSGRLNNTMYGRSVKPPQPPNLWKSVSMVSSSTYAFTPDSGERIYRRSVYSFWKRAMPPPQMTIFDAPTRESCIARRERTNTPVQALVLMNESQFFLAAQRFARQLLADASLSDADRLQRAYETITSRRPDATELARLLAGLQAQRDVYRQDLPTARKLTEAADDADDARRTEVAAYTMLINAIFNLDIAKTRE